MKLKKLSIKNFKSIKAIEIVDFQDVNVFIGKNDAGKSNILGVLDILFNSNLQKYNPSLEIESEGLLESNYKGTSQYMFYNKTRHECEMTVHLEISKKELGKFNIQVDGNDNELVLSKKIISGNKSTNLVMDFIRVNKTVLMKAADEKKRFLNSKNAYIAKLESSLVLKLLEQLSNEFIMIPANRNIIRSGGVGSEKEHVEQYIKDSLMELANSDDPDKKILFDQFTAFIDKISPLIDKVVARTSGKKVVDIDFRTSSGENIPLSTIGGGNNELLLLLHEIIVSGGLIMAIEEPEIHLHPQAERKLYRFMEEFSATTQMFIVTHSPVFVQPENIRGLFRVVKKKGETKVYSMDEKDYINKDRLEQELNSENCEMFFADRVLLVEGISDKIFMEGLIEKRCKSTDEIKVVSAYSKDNFEVYVDLLKIFEIPYIVLTDLDAIKGQFWIKIIWKELKHNKMKDRNERIKYLKTKGIHVLSKGALESCYPHKYRKGVSKPLDALYAILNLTDEEYNSDRMRDLKEVIEALEK